MPGDKKENESFQIRFQSKSQNNEKLQSGQYGTRTRIRGWTYVFYQRTALKNKTRLKELKPLLQKAQPKYTLRFITFSYHQ